MLHCMQGQQGACTAGAWQSSQLAANLSPHSLLQPHAVHTLLPLSLCTADTPALQQEQFWSGNGPTAAMWVP